VVDFPQEALLLLSVDTPIKNGIGMTVIPSEA